MKLFLTLFLLILCAFAKGGEATITTYLEQVSVADPIEYKNIRLFPIITTKILSAQTYITLDEATERDWLKIKETGSGQVNFVQVKNTSTKMIFVMTGEIISGAKQDRMLKEDILIPPKSSWIKVPVYCVEHGRWTQVSAEFTSEKLLAPNALRQRAKISESQSEVWDEIATSQERMGVMSTTGTVRANYADKKVQKEIDEYVKRLEKVPRLSNLTIGVVATTGNRIICFDMFANNDVLKKFWNKLIKSYTMDVLAGEKGIIDKKYVEDFIQALEHAHYTSTGTPGRGELVEIESDFGRGSALTYRSAVIHMDFFPTEAIRDVDEGLRLDFRREQRLKD